LEIVGLIAMPRLYRSGHVPIPEIICTEMVCTKVVVYRNELDMYGTEVGQNGCTILVHVIVCIKMVCTEMDTYRSGPNPINTPDYLCFNVSLSFTVYMICVQTRM